MSVIGEAALCALFQVLYEKLASLELLNFASEAQVREEIQGWEDKLQTLRGVLDDAEDKQIQSRSVKLWLGKLKHLAYDVEDILDEFATECLRRKLKREQQAASTSKLIGEHQASAITSKIHKLIPACCTSFTPLAVMFNSDVMSKIKDITARFEGILKEMKELNSLENVRTTSSRVSQRSPSSCVPDEPIVYGRHGDKDKIIDLLFRYETGDAQVGVIPIVGMGGLGKTTLAKLVYNDDSILDHFQVKAWVCVSDVFDIMKVTKDILVSITSQTSDLTQLSDVQLQLNRQLSGKKFLLVLDDVWTDNYDNWHALRPPLMDGAPGSKIIVTTRSADVATRMGTVQYYKLKKISDEDCWLLFKKHAFENNTVAQSELEKIGREIINKRCGGLPLAARTLGGLLRSKERHNEWEEVLNNKLWSVLDENSNILSVLELSYHYLPSHLKRCFAYCAILPKDYEFEQEEIILLWMAEGLIPQANDIREMEDLGGDYFRDLLSRSFFQASSIYQSQFVMHDLVNDLAQKVAGDACLKLEGEVNVGEEFPRERVRHSSYIRGGFADTTKRFSPFYKMKCLRTFLPVSRERWYGTGYLASCVPYELLKNLKCLRVLSFRRYNIEELPNSIGDLKHLRYLDISYTKIKVLPESTTLLCNLQTLILTECRKLMKLPVRMDNLINLRFLDMTGVNLIEGIPLKIKELRNLQTLSNIVIDKEFFPLSNLMSLKSLRGGLSLLNLNNVVDASDAVNAKLKDKEGIRVLQLRWKTLNTKVEDEGVHYDVLNGLQPHQNIEKLSVAHYGGTRFPSWIGDPMFNNIVQLRLEDCEKCTSLPQLGLLPNLKELFIIGMSSLQRVDQDFYGNNCSNSFPCLEVLHFDKMHIWEEWNAFEFEFRVLRELFITNCENLVAALPSLPMLSMLEIRSCKEVDFGSKVDFNSLSRVVLVDISSITNLAKEGFQQRLKKLQNLQVSRSESWELESDWECKFWKCPQLMSMVVDEDEKELQMEVAGSELESLELRGCGMLVKLPTWIQKMVFLKKLEILNCESLAELTVCDSQCLEELTIECCDSLIFLGRRQLPPTLKKLSIKECKNLKSLLDKEDEGETCSSSSSIINLEVLEIRSCESLTSISSRRDLPPTLKHFLIYKCSNLTYVLPTGKLPSGLQSLRVCTCEKIESIAEGFDYNSSLETLSIYRCSSLKSLPEGLHNLINLCDFILNHCPFVMSFPEGGLPTKCLTKLTIENLEKLEALPDNLHRLSSLQELNICDFPNMVSLPSEALPSNLTSLYISSKQSFECGLERLHSLRRLCIYGGIGERRRVLWDKTGTMLPPSLTCLTIRDFPNLKYLSTRGFRNLTSLETLYIWDCPKLASFPKNGLPDSLLGLEVFFCPTLKQRCKEGKTPQWSKILHIPHVEIY